MPHFALLDLEMGDYSEPALPDGGVAPVAVISSSGRTHLFWGVPTDPENSGGAVVREVQHTHHDAGEWEPVRTVIPTPVRWTWGQSAATHSAGSWTGAFPDANEPALHVLRLDGDGLDVQRIPLPGILPVAASTITREDGSVMIALLAGPPDSGGRLALYTVESDDGRAFSGPDLIPVPGPMGFRQFRLVSRGNRTTLLWTGFGAAERGTIERVDLADGGWKRQPSFDTGDAIQGTMDAVLDTCHVIHIAYSTGGGQPVVKLGRWEGARHEVVLVDSAISSNPFFAWHGDHLSLYWFSFSTPDTAMVTLNRMAVSTWQGDAGASR